MRISMSPSLYQQTTLNVDESGSSVVHHSVPPSAKRRRIATSVSNEETFTQGLATEASIHFRPSTDHHPRSILYRIVDNRNVLELQAVDLRQHGTKTEALLTLRFDFANQIRHGGIAFADAEREASGDALIVFVSTLAGELFTLTLRKDAFTKSDFLEKNGTRTSDWFKSCVPNAFTLKTPFRLLARSEVELWAAMNDGSLLRLERRIDGAAWRETYYTEGGWGSSLRALVLWQGQQSVQYNDMELSGSTVISLAFSPDSRHLWTVSLDHTIKVWNVTNGKLVLHMDLAGDATRDLRKSTERPLVPTYTQLVKVIPSKVGEHYTVAAFSPKTHAIKFWTVRDLEAAAYGLEDARPDFDFVLPIDDLVDANVWTLEAFELKPPTLQEQAWELWVLIRSGLRCHVYTVSFKFHDHLDGLKRVWKHNWTEVASASDTDSLKHNLQNPSDLDITSIQASPEGPVELWTKFLFYPGRFTDSTLEAALGVYRQSLGRDVQRDLLSSMSNKSVRERVSESVGIFVSLAQGAGGVSYEKYQRDLVAQWQIFYGVVKDLHKRREDALALTFDPMEAVPWLVMADQVSPLRKAAEVELLWYNRKIYAYPDSFQPYSPLLEALTDPRNSKIGQFFHAIAVFRNTFAKSFLFSLRSVLRSESLQKGGQDTAQRIQSLYDRSGFANQVGDDDYGTLTSALGPLGGFAQLDHDTFATVLELLDETQKGHAQKKQLTKYSSRFLIAGARETLQLSYDVVVACLLLVIFAAVELEQGDMPEEFNTHIVFEALMQKAKEYELLEYLSRTLRQDTAITPQTQGESLDLRTFSDAEPVAAAPMTLLEALFIGDWASMMFPHGAEVDLLTYSCRAWTFGARLNEQYDMIASHVLGNLLKSGDRELAFEFLSFMPDTSWSHYLRARVHLMRSEFAEALIYFTRASQDIATGKFFDVEQFDSARLLGPHERIQMNEGLARYYSHIMALFETAKVMSYVADVAGLALSAYVDEGIQDLGLKTELLSRLFTASIQISRFNDAFYTLIQYTDYALRKSALHILLSALLTASQTTLLLSLPFPKSIAPEVDAYLADLAAKPTTALAVSSLSLPAPAAASSIPPHKILYAYRLGRSDLKGAAACLWTRLQTLQQQQQRGAGSATVDEEVSETYLALINALSLVDADDAWILTRPLPELVMPETGLSVKLGRIAGEKGKDKVREKRTVLTLQDIRRLWQVELDRQADMEAGRFPLGMLAAGAMSGGDDMDVDVFD